MSVFQPFIPCPLWVLTATRGPCYLLFFEMRVRMRPFLPCRFHPYLVALPLFLLAQVLPLPCSTFEFLHADSIFGPLLPSNFPRPMSDCVCLVPTVPPIVIPEALVGTFSRPPCSLIFLPAPPQPTSSTSLIAGLTLPPHNLFDYLLLQTRWKIRPLCVFPHRLRNPKHPRQTPLPRRDFFSNPLLEIFKFYNSVPTSFPPQCVVLADPPFLFFPLPANARQC